MYKIRIKSAAQTLDRDIRHSIFKILENKHRKRKQKENPSNKIILSERCNNNNLVCIFNFIFLSHLNSCITKEDHYLKKKKKRLRKTSKKFL